MIKLFENFDEGEFYKQINGLIFQNGFINGKKVVNITPQVGELLKSNKIFYRKNVYEDRYYNDFYYIPKGATNDSRRLCAITEVVDEWFFVTCAEGTFECDQVDGVERLLKDKGIIKSG